MNERIKLLKEQAMEWVPNMADPDTKIRLLNAEKFAELIVWECLSQVDKVDSMLEDDKEKTGVAWVGLAIARHFGVE